MQSRERGLASKNIALIHKTGVIQGYTAALALSPLVIEYRSTMDQVVSRMRFGGARI